MLRNEVRKFLDLKAGERVVDATLGLGGHALDMLEKIGKRGMLYAFEQDERNLGEARKRLKKYEKQIVFFNNNFRYLKNRITGAEGMNPENCDSTAGWKRGTSVGLIDAVLFDLGLSSPHVDEAERGFSFNQDGPLDMRFDQSGKLTAEMVINTYPEQALADIFYQYGEERLSRRLASAICRARKDHLFKSTVELADFIGRALPQKKGGHGKSSHPATRIFQAIRIEVNDELNALKEALEQAFSLLKTGGRMVIISYHSLEDRIVKQFFKNLERPPVSSPEKAVYQNYDDPIIEVLTKKPVIPSEKEIEENPRSRSAKLRACMKIKEV